MDNQLHLSTIQLTLLILFSKFPSLLFAGENDALVPPKDLEKLKQLLVPVNVKFIMLKHYAHADYIWGETCKELVFDPTVEFIKTHTEFYSIP